MDVAGPMSTSLSGNRYIFIILDDFSKFVWLLTMRNITSKNVIKSLQAGVFNSFSSCEKIITDNGSCFRSVECKNFMFKLGIEHHRITSYFDKKQRVWDTELNCSLFKLALTHVLMRVGYW